jgi:RimJ/RimL family protein N-acetyltransferase
MTFDSSAHACDPGPKPTDPLFSTDRGALGGIEFRPLDPDSDLAIVHDWVNRDYARFWRMQGMSLPEVEAAYREKLGRENYSAYIGIHLPTKKRVFLCETYNPLTEELGKHYNSVSTDRGLHFIRAPRERIIGDFSWHLLMAVTEFIFCDPSVKRIVLEPDIANRKMIYLLLQCGYSPGGVIHLRHKTARFVFISRERFSAVNASGTRLDLEYSPNPVTLGYHRLAGRIRRRISRGIW